MAEIDVHWPQLLAAARGASADAALAATADPLVALYLPLCGAATGQPFTIGHLGQSLDGFVATTRGESLFITGEENVVHMHRLRALCDAVVVGASTVLADDSRLTTRLVPGPNPLRVVIDPRRRLPASLRLFSDGAAPTLLVCEADRAQPGERFGGAEVVGLPARDGRLDYAAILGLLRGRGCRTVFVEGGAHTVSGFLAAGLLDRLQITVAPVLLGDGLPGVRVPAAALLDDAAPLAHRVVRMGDDVLFDCDAAGIERQ
jgi:riboflavin-specific deaminase-like protein